MSGKKRLPAYHAMQASYHAAFAHELQTMIKDLPVCRGDRVLDVGCGDGTFTAWLAPLVAPTGSVTAVDLNPAYLSLARRRLAGHAPQALVRFRQGNIDKLPFAANTFDLVWCAQSLFSFPDPLHSLREMTRMVRRGGIVAVLEDDTLHQLLIPWPIDLEIALRQAEWRAFQSGVAQPRNFYIARGLRTIFAKAGLRPQLKRTYAAQRAAPLTPDEKRYVDCYLKSAVDRGWPYLSPVQRRQCGQLLQPTSPDYLPNQPEFSMTCLDHVMWGKKP